MAKKPAIELRYVVFYSILAGLSIGLFKYSGTGRNPERLEQRIESRTVSGKSVPLHYYVDLHLHRAAKTNAILTGALALLGWVALRRPARTPGPAQSSAFFQDDSDSPAKAWMAVTAVAACIAWSAIVNAPRLEQSLWGDEEYTVRQFVVGEFKHSPGTDRDRQLTFVAHSWQDAMFGMKTTNNHVLNSVVAKVAHETTTSPPDPSATGLYFDEKTLRMPGYLVGLAAIAALSWCLWTTGWRSAAVAAPILLVMHPWFVRYSTELRGYVYVLFFAPLTLGLMWNAIRQWHWKWWILYGLSQIGLFWAYLGSLHLLIATNFAGVLLIFLQPPGAKVRSLLFARFALVNLAAAMVLWQLYAPCVPQVRAFLEKPNMKGDVPLSQMEDALSSLLTGVRWQPFTEGHPLAVSWRELFENSWPLAASAAGLTVAFLLLGLWTLARRSRLSACLIPALLLPAPLFVLQALIGGNRLYLWYLVIALPGAVALMSVGATHGLTMLRRPGAKIAVAAIFLTLFGVATAEQRKHLRERSSEPLRESVALYRPNLNPLSPANADTVSLEVAMHPRGYDPAAIKTPDYPSFQKQTTAARAGGKPLYVNLSMPELAREHLPEIMAELEDPEKFERLEVIQGQDFWLDRHIFKLIHDNPQDD